jgi:hypothetical protein
MASALTGLAGMPGSASSTSAAELVASSIDKSVAERKGAEWTWWLSYQDHTFS